MLTKIEIGIRKMQKKLPNNPQNNLPNPREPPGDT